MPAPRDLPHDAGRAVRRWWAGRRPRRADLKADVVAGLPGAVSSVPDGMAAAVLAGVNPVHGLYASVAGPITGGLTASSRMMVITTTSAAALAAGSAVESVPAEDRSKALLLLSVVSGLVMVAAALLRLGRYVRFVSHSVMAGFLTGVAVNIVLGQLADLVGSDESSGFAATTALAVVLHPGSATVASALVGVAALGILYLLSRTRLALVASLVALAVPTAVVLIAGLDEVARVSDVGDIPHGLPPFALPELSLLTPALMTGAISVAAIVLVQGVGVAQGAPNRHGTKASTGADFAAQGCSNVMSGLFGGQPVGGSVGQTSLNLAAGARTHWASIFTGAWMLLILVAFSAVVGEVAMPTLAAILIFAGIGSIRPGELRAILAAGRTSRIAAVSTFVATLLLPVAAAVAVGVGVSLVLQLNQDAVDLRLVRLRPRDDGRFEESDPPARLADRDVVALDVYGSLFYAGAHTLERRLPAVSGARHAIVVLRLRGRVSLGATFLTVIGAYAGQLAAGGGHLYLTGLDAGVVARWDRQRFHLLAAGITLRAATPLIGESTLDALLEAETRVVVNAPSDAG
ncbi:MAG: SulP family inorganic anion transporter [Aeromicrobium sp.]